ncbi:uncharacterized protein RJT20DRAFT_131557 [Scheffersomyces xylosifermentans]|uniref:uncharacterized protein n=1 Tax=Scheffersomyces xylosifermentans TaxID=1304137 RepID=UPI00315D5E57
MAKNTVPKEELKVVSGEPVSSLDDTTAAPAPKETKETKPVESEIPIDEAKPAEPAKSAVTDVVDVPLTENNDDDNGPPQPPRPVDAVTRVTNELKEAFPNIEEKIITAVLIASQGVVDPAFNALLYISDPSFKPEIPEPKEAVASVGGSTVAPTVSAGSKGLTEDELLARRLQKEFEKEDAARRHRRADREKRKQRKEFRDPNEFDDSPDEFDQIKQTFTQGLEEAKTTLNGWVSGFTKRFDGEGNSQQQNQKQNPKLFGALGGSSFGNENTRKGSKFDEDPEIISHDFHHRISLHDNDNEDLPAMPKRPSADLNKKLPQEPQSDTPTSVQGSKKWQPLDSDVPANSDAFLVTDSEEEDADATKKTPVL